jgi:DNA polymerase V
MQTLDAICGVSATTGLLPTATGYAVVEANPGKLEQGCTVVLSLYGRQQFVKLIVVHYGRWRGDRGNL